MAFQSIWYFSDLPKDIVDIIEKDLSKDFDNEMEDSTLMGSVINKDMRNSQNAWIPTNHWLGGFLWNYVERANRENFLYDLTCIDHESMQYTQYKEGQFYGWHNDSGLSVHYKPESMAIDGASERNFISQNTEMIRKLSFVLQLSNPDDYEGGNFQLMDEFGKNYIAPRVKGTVILFDSRTMHRVQKVKKGLRKSIVGWVVGPRWK